MSIPTGFPVFKAIFSPFVLLWLSSPHYCSQIVVDKDQRENLAYMEAKYQSTFLIPCLNAAEESVQSIEIVLLYFNTKDTPIFTADARQRSIAGARIWSKYYLNDRLHLGRFGDNFGVWMKNLTFNESGIYTCRVVAKHSPTRDQMINLKVIDFLQGVKVFDGKNKILENDTIVGPLPLGQKARFKCIAIGGSPPPYVKWRIDGIEVKTRRRRGRKKAIKFIDLKLSRQDLGRILTCEAANSKYGAKYLFKLTLDVILPPLSASITVGKNFPLIKNGPKIFTMKEKSHRNLTCNVVGAHPSAQVVWKGEAGSGCGRRDGRLQVMKMEVVRDGLSVLKVRPDFRDNEFEISCHAFNPLNEDIEMSDLVKLNILFRPQIELKPLNNLDITRVNPQTNVFLKCDILANPPPRRTIWFHEGTEILPGKKYVITRTDLVLLEVNKTQAGNYFCESWNSLGKSRSNTLNINVTHLPECLRAKSLKIRRKDQIIYLNCQVSSSPPVIHYRWYDRSAGNKLLATSNYNTLKINNTQLNNRYIDCYAENDIGVSYAPCQFEVINKEDLDPLTKCEIFEDEFGSKNMMVFSCLPQPQIDIGFIFEIYVNTNSSETLLQKRNSSVPMYFVRGLLPGRRYCLKVYSTSENRQSTPLTLSFTVPQEIKESSTDKSSFDFVLTTMIPLLAFTVGIVLIVIICACVAADKMASTYMKWKYTNEWLKYRYLQMQKCEPFDDNESYIIGGRMIVGENQGRTDILLCDYNSENVSEISGEIGRKTEENFGLLSKKRSSGEIAFELKENFHPNSSSQSNFSYDSDVSSDVSTVIFKPSTYFTVEGNLS